MASSDEKLLAGVAWVSILFSAFLGPVIIYFLSAGKPHARRHAALALAHSIVGTVGGIICGLLTFVLIGFVLAPILGIWLLFVGVIGALAGFAGNDYHPAVIGNLARSIERI